MAVQISNIVFLNLLYCYISVSSPKPPSQCNMKKDSYISFTLCNSRVISKWDLGKCRLCLEKMNPAMLVIGSVLSACWSPLLKWIKREEENSTARALRKSHKIHIWVDHPIYLPKVINSQIRHASSCQLTFENWITWEHDKERWAIALHKQADVRKTRAALCSFHVTGVGDNRQGEITVNRKRWKFGFQGKLREIGKLIPLIHPLRLWSVFAQQMLMDVAVHGIHKNPTVQFRWIMFCELYSRPSVCSLSSIET